MVTQSLKGVRALSAGPRRGKFPVTPDVLRLLCLALQQNTMEWESSVLVRLKAMFLLSFYAFLRVGELCGSRHAILIDNVRLQPAYITIQFPSYKFSTGRCPSVFIPSQDSDLCPVKALSSYVRLRGSRPGPLFLYPNGDPCLIPPLPCSLIQSGVCCGFDSSWDYPS